MIKVDITHDGMDFEVDFYDREDYEPYGLFTYGVVNGAFKRIDVTHNFTDEALGEIYAKAAYEDRTASHEY